MPSVALDPVPIVASEQDENLSLRDKFIAAVLHWDTAQEAVRFKKDGANQPPCQDVTKQQKLTKILKK